ncbi:hypothetical protein BAUCODRAFT_37604 [Baudoinia panamericana UAMH 10762]|uniref:Uncharacterized protein n=1 Tax=Baudoinia panamericana (strain UAMH 10762) TaxID=717646 RepID=M2LF92_BAUPA|nr:uncharacterized protein BAUCODRAFT_37604 [Baudoinia panamericana UAMH 10762]EMC92702.1 hypothetical protein BAUCODRAFT_37604 [Baudoinia panamericana UAMH 10762]
MTQMIDNQRQNEIRWYSERQTLKQVQAQRVPNATKNRVSSAQPATPSEETKQAELTSFDRKIYDAQVSMEEAMATELKGLGVPFFGTDHHLVVLDGIDVTAVDLPEGHPKWSPLVTESELTALKRKMVTHLEDLYRD